MTRFATGRVGLVVWWRHLQNGWSIVTAIGIVIFVVSSAIALGPRILETATGEDLTETIRSASPEQRNIRFGQLTEIGAGAPGRAFSNVEWIGDQLRDDHIPSSVLALVSQQQWLFDSPQFIVGSYPDQIEAQFAPTFRFREQSEIEEHSQLIAGTLPMKRDPELRLEGPDCPEEVSEIEAYEPPEGVLCGLVELPLFETAVSPITAEELGVEIGDRLMLRPDPTALGFRTAAIGVAPVRIVLEISGIIGLDDRGDEFWYGDTLLHQPRTVENSDFRLVFAAGLLGGDQYRPFRDAVHAAGLDFSWRYVLDPDLVEGADPEQLVTDVEKIAPPDTEVFTLLPTLLEDHIAQRRLTLQVWSLILAVFAGAAATVVLTLARGDAIRRRGISALMTDRGASKSQLLALNAGTAVVLTTLAATAGGALGWMAFPSTSSRVPTIGVLLFGLGCVAAITAAGREREAAGRARLVVMSSFLLGLTSLVVALLRRRDSGVGDATSGAFDLTLTVAPVLVVGSVAVLGAWAIGPLARLGARMAEGSRGEAWLIGFRRLGAQQESLRGPLLAVVMAAGLAVLAIVLSTSISASQEESSFQFVGAEYRVEMTIVGIGLPDQLMEGLVELDPDVTFGAVLPFERFIGPSSGFVADLVALDNGPASASAQGPGVDLVGPWNAPHLPGPGDQVRLTAGGFAVPLQVNAHVERVAGFDSTRAVIVIDRASLADATNEAFAAATVAFVGPTVDQSELEALVEDVPAVQLVSRRTQLAEITGDPLSTWTRRGLLTGAIGGVALAIAAAVAAVMVGSPARTRDLSFLTVLGVERRGVVRVAMAELAPLFAATVLFGLVSGVLTARLLGPNLSLKAFADGTASAGVVIDGTSLLITAAALVGALGIALAIVARAMRRLDHAMMLRRGSD